VEKPPPRKLSDAAGGFFRGPVEEIGFVDLTDWLKTSGWYDRIVASRFAPYSVRGHIFGLPHDVHPVMIAYRRDLFAQAGVDPSKIRTWDDFIEVGHRLTKDLDGDGTPDRYMMELEDNWSSHLETLLFQRGGGYFDDQGRLIMDNAIGLKTLTWYVPLVAGKERIGSSLPFGQVLNQALDSGFFVCTRCPDWYTKFLEMDVPRLSGKMALMPLPAFEPGGRRTSTWGGTMIAVTKHCKQPELAKALAVHLYLEPRFLAERFASTNIIPALKEAWHLPEFSRRREYWSGQAIGQEFAALAEETPPQYTSPFIELAKGKLGEAVSLCVTYYRKNGAQGFDAFADQTLKRCANDVRKQMARNPF
jgi:arabinosaccharide transport system substrate-binding protein